MTTISSHVDFTSAKALDQTARSVQVRLCNLAIEAKPELAELSRWRLVQLGELPSLAEIRKGLLAGAYSEQL